MAKEAKKAEGEKAKPAKKHLHSIRTEEAEDGSYVHHHTWKGKKEDREAESPRLNAATSQSPEEAGQHVAEMFGQNDSQGGAEAQPEPAPAAEAEPAPGGAMPGA